MAHPYKSAAHKNDPKWVKGLENAKMHQQFTDKDLQATVRDKTANPRITAQAAYASKGKGK